MASSVLSALSFIAFFYLASVHVSAQVVYEDGYTVTTVLDGNKLKISPYLALSQPGSPDLIVLDSKGSSFYTVTLPTSPSADAVIRNFSGTNGVDGFEDGDSTSAKFKEPKSFAIDSKGNVYVADRANFAIRKISKSGVTTIAGGYSKKPGRWDGPGKEALFSDLFEVVFAPERCALMISDRGNKLIREINLKAEDCKRGSQSVVGTPMAWILGLVLSCLLGLIIGFVIRPYVIPHEEASRLHLNETWRHCLINLGRQAKTPCFAIRSAIARSRLYALVIRLIMLAISHVFLTFSFSLAGPKSLQENSVSFLDSDHVTNAELAESQKVDGHMKDLIGLGAGLDVLGSSSEVLEQNNGKMERNDGLSESGGKIHKMIEANITEFAVQAKTTSGLEYVNSCCSSLVKRR